jgi:hypothetical protein
MNIICQNSPYVSRTNLINTTSFDTSNIEYDLSVLSSNYYITSNGIYEDLNPLTWLINSEPQSNYYPPTNTSYYNSNTYIYNNDNNFGQIRFWVQSTSNFPVLSVPEVPPDYRVKIDVDGKLKLYYTYQPLLNLTFLGGWIDVANLLVGADADSKNQLAIINGILAKIALLDNLALSGIDDLAKYIDELVELNELTTYVGREDIEDLIASTRETFVFEEGVSAISQINNQLSGLLTTGRVAYLGSAINSIGNIITNNPLTAFCTGFAGSAFLFGYAIFQNYDYNKTINKQILKQIELNSNLSISDRRQLYDYTSNNLISSNLFDFLENNYYLNKEQGFINCNITSNQYVQNLICNKIGIGINTSSFPLDVIGSINADYYYRANVKQFVGTEIQNCNLALSQGFINSNILSNQYIPNLNTNEILIKNLNVSNLIDNKILITSNNLINYVNNNSNVLNTSNNLINYTNYNYNILNTKINNNSNDNYNYNLYTSNSIYQNYNNLSAIDELIFANLGNDYNKKTTFLISTTVLLNYNSINYYTYTIDLTKYLRYIQISDTTKLLRFKIMSSLASSVAVFDYLTESEYTVMMSQSSTIGQTGGFHCRAFGTPEDLNLTKYAPYKFIKTNNIYQLSFLSAVENAKFIITIIDLF